MDIYEIRLRKINFLLESCSSRKVMAAKIEMDIHLLGKYITRGKSHKKMGDVVARRIEQKFGKPEGWMDWVEPEWTSKSVGNTGKASIATSWPFQFSREDFINLPQNVKSDIFEYIEFRLQKHKKDFQAKHKFG